MISYVFLGPEAANRVISSGDATDFILQEDPLLRAEVQAVETPDTISEIAQKLGISLLKADLLRIGGQEDTFHHGSRARELVQNVLLGAGAD